jgi:hypothetical protein
VTPAATLAAMAQSKRPLPQLRDVRWDEHRRRAAEVFRWLQAGWNALSAQERDEVRRLITQSRGRPHNLTRAETQRLGRLAAKAAQAAAARHRS